MDTVINKPKRYWGKTIGSFLLVLLLMPLGHASMIIMEQFMQPGALHVAAFMMGLIGFLLVIIGVFVKGDFKQTLFGLVGALLFWSGWVEFLFKYYADRYHTLPEIEHGIIVTKPEYLIMPASFGFFMMFFLIYVFCDRNGCRFFTWIQKFLFRGKRDIIVVRPMTRHVSVVTFMEFNCVLWASYLLLMFCYDKNFLGDHHPVTFIVGFLCLISSIAMFVKELRIGEWGANIRMAIATVIVFWMEVEVLGRVNFFNEIWLHPMQYKSQMLAILITFIVLALIVIFVRKNKKKTNS
jgi:nicotinamide riboside transporter PnuC